MSPILQGTELIQFLENNSPEKIKEVLEHVHPADILDALEDYEGNPLLILARIPNDVLVSIIEEAEEEDKNDLLSLLPHEQKKEVISEMASDELADMWEYIDEDEAELLISAMEESKAEELKALLQHDPETAGGIMATEFVSVSDQMSVKQALEYLQKHGDDAESISYLYMLDIEGRVHGVVSLRDIVTSKFDVRLSDLANPNVITVPTDMDQEEVAQVFIKYGFSGVPVVDEAHKMVGIITADDVLDIVVDESTEDIERMSALAHGEREYLESGVLNLAKRRIFWLLFLMISATFTGIIIEKYEVALSSTIILAAFIPVLMDTGGNAGSQSATLVIRGMALGEISMKDFFKVLYIELRVSLLVGGVLAGVNWLRIGLTSMHEDKWLLGFTVSAAMFVTVMIANLVGCVLPLLARRFKMDPAIMASPVITTIVDALALLVYFGIATSLYIK
ncbi:MAG: magnesium transporter [Candidatus Cloacimonetes bacterium]|nr:magnesium transporter [Candidatus Cloacimonadota bacterium]NLO11954.1 magnesium transporter [Candidatus Cloacimonadota bacterium]